MNYSKNQEDLAIYYYIHGTQLNDAERVIDLGIIFEKQLDFDDHRSCVLDETNCKLKIIEINSEKTFP